MTISLVHPMATVVADGADTTLVRPTNWNAGHTLTVTTNRLLGRVDVGAGAVSDLSSTDVYTALGWVAATSTDFVQTAAPTGWTKQTTHDNKALRVVTGTASSGGSTAFTSVFTSRTIATANVPSHAHTFSAASGSTGPQSVTFGSRTSWTYNVSTNSTGFDGAGGSTAVTSANETNDTMTATAAAHTHGFSFTSSGIGSGTAMDFAVQYVDVILAARDA